MSIYGWILTLFCPLPVVLIFVYVLRRVLPLFRRVVFFISLYAATLLTQILAGFMQLVHSEMSVVVLGVVVSSIYASYLGAYLIKKQSLIEPIGSRNTTESFSEPANRVSRTHPILKWLAPVIATIIGGVIMWWLTQSDIAPLKGGPLLKITAFHVSEPIHAKERVYAEVTVYNEGGRTAEGCRLTWYPSYYYNEWPNESEGSFGVPPNMTGKGKAWIIFQESGEIETTYGIVGCNDGISPADKSFFPKRKVHVLMAR